MNFILFQVGWLRAADQTVLALQDRVVTHNARISVNHENYLTWRLRIKQLRETDKGCYMCQINSSPMKKQIGCIDVQSELSENIEKKGRFICRCYVADKIFSVCRCWCRVLFFFFLSRLLLMFMLTHICVTKTSSRVIFILTCSNFLCKLFSCQHCRLSNVHHLVTKSERKKSTKHTNKHTREHRTNENPLNTHANRKKKKEKSFSDKEKRIEIFSFIF